MTIISAALIIIGDEILSGRTIDANLAYIAKRLNQHGIQLQEVRVVSDNEANIIEAVQALKSRYNYVLTTGGIGPTHDDITSPTIAKALGLPWQVHPKADELLRAYYAKLNLPYNDARRNMATMPLGAVLVDNPISVAPAYMIENILVLAGVPKIMQAMLENAIPLLQSGATKKSLSCKCKLGEGTIAQKLSLIQDKYPIVAIGSYPNFDAITGLSVTLVASSIDETLLKNCFDDILAMIRNLGDEPVIIGDGTRIS